MEIHLLTLLFHGKQCHTDKNMYVFAALNQLNIRMANIGLHYALYAM